LLTNYDNDRGDKTLDVSWVGINRIVSKLDELIKQNYDFNTKLVETSGKVNNLTDRVVMNEKRLDNHASRIRHLELNDKYFKEK